MKKPLIIAMMLLLLVYVGAYAFVRLSYDREHSYTYVIAGTSRLIVPAAKLFAPLCAIEHLVTGRPAKLYRVRAHA